MHFFLQYIALYVIMKNDIAFGGVLPHSTAFLKQRSHTFYAQLYYRKN
jgi:hypothetical protein